MEEHGGHGGKGKEKWLTTSNNYGINIEGDKFHGNYDETATKRCRERGNFK